MQATSCLAGFDPGNNDHVDSLSCRNILERVGVQNSNKGAGFSTSINTQILGQPTSVASSSWAARKIHARGPPRFKPALQLGPPVQIERIADPSPPGESLGEQPLRSVGQHDLECAVAGAGAIDILFALSTGLPVPEIDFLSIKIHQARGRDARLRAHQTWYEKFAPRIRPHSAPPSQILPLSAIFALRSTIETCGEGLALAQSP
jgi:hypothetical protein